MIAEVQLWGRTIGAVSLEEGREVAAFQYDPAFARSGIELSPLAMPHNSQHGAKRRAPSWQPDCRRNP